MSLRLALGLALLAGCEIDSFCLDCVDTLDGFQNVDGGEMGVADGGPPDAGFDLGCIPSPAELCNTLDDDCDGLVDEGFDLLADPNFCGSCDVSCALPNVDAVCQDGLCVERGCLEGFADLVPGEDEAAGCEYRCPIFPTQPEVCDGLDDDCDGRVDEELTEPANFCRTTAGTLCEGARPVCATRAGVTTWFCDYPVGVEFDPEVPDGITGEETRCDGVDGDCDGLVDDLWPELGELCDNGLLGACRDLGAVACAADGTSTTCDFSLGADPVPGAPLAEVCNGVDDDCNGVADDATGPGRVRDAMVRVTSGGLDFFIYAYEASRPDASDADGGVSSVRACSQDGVLPWANVGFAAAEAACAAAGHRLCTGAEWLAACEGAAGSAYPYGASYEAATCNGGDRDAFPGGPVDHVVAPTGALALCTSEAGAFDLSGNLKEWTDDVRGSVGGQDIVVNRGGNVDSPALGLTCQTELSQATADTILPTLGFRCCSDAGP